jgi:hypothetical protein
MPLRHLGAWFIANLDVIAGEAKVARRPGETLALAAMTIFAAQRARAANSCGAVAQPSAAITSSALLTADTFCRA